MFKKLKKISGKYWEIIVYLAFGVLTTLTNFLVYFPLLNLAGFSAAISNAIAWFAAVVVAFVTNKAFVFESNIWSLKVVAQELAKFLGCRIGSGVLETLLLALTVDLFQWDGNVWKLLTSVLVVILNYIGSKLFVFRKNGN